MVSLTAGGFKGSGNFSGQGFRVEFERTGPGPYDSMVDEGVAVRGASVEAVVRTVTEVKERIRAYIDSHFGNSRMTKNLHRRAANASAQSAFYDELESKGQYAGLIYSKLGYRSGGNFVDFLLLHVRGGAIRPGSGEWLRLPNRNAAYGARKTGFDAASQSDVFFMRSKDGQELLQFRRRRGSAKLGINSALELIAVLVKQVVIPASLSEIEQIARQRANLFEGYFADALDKREGTAQPQGAS